MRGLGRPRRRLIHEAMGSACTLCLVVSGHAIPPPPGITPAITLCAAGSGIPQIGASPRSPSGRPVKPRLIPCGLPDGFGSHRAGAPPSRISHAGNPTAGPDRHPRPPARAGSDFAIEDQLTEWPRGHPTKSEGGQAGERRRAVRSGIRARQQPGHCAEAGSVGRSLRSSEGASRQTRSSGRDTSSWLAGTSS